MATDTKNVYQRLLEVQSNLVAPRQPGGRFGKARSAEQILEALKPQLKKSGLLLTTTETITQREDRFYLTCTATVVNTDKPEEQVAVVAEAREGVEERGLDPSQVTGKASSYAKKYALQHLFSIDDTKDADHVAPGEPKEAAPPAKPDEAANQLARAKKKINEELEFAGYDTTVSKQAFVNSVLMKTVISSLNDADAVMDAIENQKEVA